MPASCNKATAKVKLSIFEVETGERLVQCYTPIHSEHLLMVVCNPRQSVTLLFISWGFSLGMSCQQGTLIHALAQHEEAERAGGCCVPRAMKDSSRGSE